MRKLVFLSVVIVGFSLSPWIASRTHAGPDTLLEIIAKPTVRTNRLGGVDVPGADVLREMHFAQYVLRAARGKLTRVPAEKVLLPHSDRMSPQGVNVDIGPDGSVWVKQTEIFCKSTDGGRTWTSRPFREPGGKTGGSRWRVLCDGSFITVTCAHGEAHDPAVVWVSADAGMTWTRRAEIPIEMPLPTGKPYVKRYTHRGLHRLDDDTLLWSVDIRDEPYTEGVGLFTFRSTDHGHTWQGPLVRHDWGSEGGATLLPSGRVFATVRYQRHRMPGDDHALLEESNRSPKGSAWKNVFLFHSDDGGLTWSPPRQLTTVYGQTFGYPAAQSDGTAVVIHDTRYGPGPPGSRAMISRDEGQTWLDEVYYLDSTTFTGSYTASVVLDDDMILTIAGSSQAGNSWEAVTTATDVYAIRWKPVKD